MPNRTIPAIPTMKGASKSTSESVDSSPTQESHSYTPHPVDPILGNQSGWLVKTSLIALISMVGRVNFPLCHYVSEASKNSSRLVFIDLPDNINLCSWGDMSIWYAPEHKDITKKRTSISGRPLCCYGLGYGNLNFNTHLLSLYCQCIADSIQAQVKTQYIIFYIIQGMLEKVKVMIHQHQISAALIFLLSEQPLLQLSSLFQCWC